MLDDIFSNHFGCINGLEEFDILLCQLPRETKLKVRNMIQDHILKKIKEVSRTQFIDIPASCLKRGDIILDLKQKYIQRVHYVSHYDATHRLADGINDNTIMICYGDNYDCDNVGIESTVTILIDTADYIERKCMNDEVDEIGEFDELDS
jgi:hypothetical protein